MFYIGTNHAIYCGPKNRWLSIVVSFQDILTGSPSSWSWTFGDGSSSTHEDPVNTCLKAWSYSVILKISNVASANTIARSKYITVPICLIPTPTVPPTPMLTPPYSIPVIIIEQNVTLLTQGANTTASYSPFAVTNDGGQTLPYTVAEQVPWLLNLMSWPSGGDYPRRRSWVWVSEFLNGESIKSSRYFEPKSMSNTFRTIQSCQLSLCRKTFIISEWGWIA